MEGLTSSFVTMVSVRAILAVVQFPILPTDRLQTLLTDRPPAVLVGGAIVGMRVKGDVVFLVEDEQHLEKGRNVWVNMQRCAIQIRFGANTSLVGKPMLIKGAGTIGFVYFFEDEQTEGGITTGATFDLSIAERTLEEDASFPIGETYGWCSMKDNVLCAS